MHLHFKIYKSLVVISCLGMLLSCSGGSENTKSDTGAETAKEETAAEPEGLSLS